ncbi:hypothetical protein IWW37_002368 [Coemansia sp. RSA 2050]|nr:hypothetical protein IWW37_002368 [Coemansia sp. RSA 2050]KAJ2733700.1 hypothetical protein IW152_002883 [Coemansia sp. BCRC 34962]
MSLRLLASVKHRPITLRASFYQCRHASILGPEHHPRQLPRAPTTRVTCSPQQQALASVSQHKSPISAGFSRPVPNQQRPPTSHYIFRHRGSVPSEPQAIDSLQFILNQKPLGATVLVSRNEGARLFMLGTQVGSVEVKTADEAREMARLRLEELNDIVKSASGIMAALSRAHAAKEATTSGHAKELVAAVDGVSQVVEAENGLRFNRRMAIAASSLLGLGGAVCLGVLLAPELVGIL